MRFLTILLVATVGCQTAFGQTTGEEVIKKFRTAIDAEAITKAIPYLIQYRGERYLYTLRDGRLLGESFPFEGKLYGITNKRQMHRKEMEMKIGIVPFKVVEVINGDKGWYQMNEGESVAMSKAELEGREHREIHAEIFLGRQSFEGGHWQFTEPKGAQVRGLDTWMFEARTKGSEPLTLYFAKQSGLLARLKMKTVDFAWLPGEKPKVETFTRDLFFNDWKKVGPRMLPGHLQAFHDGVLWQQMEPTSVSLMDSVDAKLFAAPQPRK